MLYRFLWCKGLGPRLWLQNQTHGLSLRDWVLTLMDFSHFLKRFGNFMNLGTGIQPKMWFFWIAGFLDSPVVLTILTSLPTSTACAHKKNLPVHPWHKTCVWKGSPKKGPASNPEGPRCRPFVVGILLKNNAGVKLKNSDKIPCSKNIEPIYSITPFF